jgi:hypothetical protein
MESKSILNNTAKILLPLLLGGAILYWMYRDFDFKALHDVLWHQMDWTWMLLSFPFGILAQMFRGWRWRQTLEPVIEGSSRKEDSSKKNPLSSKKNMPRNSVLVNSIFLSYAASLVIPRIGEFTRCGVLKRYDGVSFSKALGTVVTERAVDSLVVLLFSGLTLLMQIPVFKTFFSETGTSIDAVFSRFTTTGWLVTAVCALAALILLHVLLRHLSIYNKVRATLQGIWQGVISLKDVRNVPLFLCFTFGIWLSYFLHYYLTFFCFDFTEHLGLTCAMVTFVVGSIAVIVPTPNGAGPWHFAVKTMLILYGVADTQALYFVLIVHTVQTMLVILLGIWASLRLSFIKRREERGEREDKRREERGERIVKRE